jgi:hypothetical protein
MINGSLSVERNLNIDPGSAGIPAVRDQVRDRRVPVLVHLRTEVFECAAEHLDLVRALLCTRSDHR